MNRLDRVTAIALLSASLALGACASSNEEPRLDASIIAMTATPQVLSRGESVDLRWRVADTLLLTLYSLPGSAMPDDQQAWRCTRERGDMVCTAPAIPATADGWACDGTSCRRSVEDDADGYAPIALTPPVSPAGTYLFWPDETTTYRLDAEGNSGTVAMAWVQVVISDHVGARIVSFHAWPTPALRGEEITISYRTEGCDTVDQVAAEPTLTAAELVPAEGNNNEQGSYTWLAATETRDFYLGCHPADEVETARIRSHITVPVIELPEVCERIDFFDVTPSADVEPGTEIVVEWQVSNAEWVEGGAEPEPEPDFYISSMRFSGRWTGTIAEDTTFSIEAHGRCHGASARHTVNVVDE
jgi:hypothetical protein